MLFSIESANIIKPLIFLVQKSCIFKIKSYLCNAFNKSTSERKFGRGGRVVDCGGLENRCTARYPGFESLSLRWKELQNKENPCKLILYGNFLFLVHGKNKHIKAFFRCTIRCTWSYAYICDIFMLSKKIKNFSKKTTTFLKKNRNFFKNVLVFFIVTNAS